MLIISIISSYFIYSKKDIRLKFKGSSNQRIIDVKSSLEYNKVILKYEYMEKELGLVR